VAAFLPDMVQPNGKRFFENLRGQLDKFAALPEAPREAPLDVEVIAPVYREKRREPINVTNELLKEAS
jgi:hypothetical protein